MEAKTDSSSSVAPNKPDMCCIACKKRKILSEGEEHSNTASSPNTHDPPRTKLQRSEYGSVTKEIEALRARKAKLLRSVSADVKALRARTWQLSNPHVAMRSKNLVILDSDEEDCCNQMHGYSATVNKPVVIIDSDEEEFEDQMRSNLCKEVVVMEPANNFPMNDLSVKWNNNPVQANDYEDKKDGNEARGSPINYDAQMDRSLPLNTEENTEARKHDEVKALGDEIEFLPDKCNIQIGESSYSGTDNHTPSRKDKKEVGYLLAKCNNRMDQRLCVGADNIVEAMEHKEIKSPSSIDKNADVVADDDVVRREHSRPTDTKDDDLVAIREEMAITLECSKVSNDTLGRVQGEEASHTSGINMKKDEGVYVGVEEGEDETEIEDDGLENIWKEMSFALECSKGVDVNLSTGEHIEVDGEECGHSFVLKDDIGDVCRICGFIQRSIDTIFEFQYYKVKRSTRTYACGSENIRDRGSTDVTHFGVKHSKDNLMATEISAHPKHRKEMKVHQVEGFNFLCRNLLTENPGGCILAHAPGSGKTFMVISFLQSFLDKNPDARPLVILPKGILDNWKKEFRRWYVGDLPLHDLYTSKAESRSQQLDVLKKWVKERSILFLGYMQFTAIVCDSASNEMAAECRNILLKIPSILILDEGHFPRNEETEVLRSLSQVQTPLKVVLSGTLYQNHVNEVFNILNLVRPKFLKFTSSREIVNRIMSRVQISKVRSNLKIGASSASAFFELVEHALQNDEDLTRKAVIQDLREMTSKALHYYKGDFLDELPGLVDFTVLLNLSPKQKSEVLKLRQLGKSKQLGKFKQTSVGSSVYMHPQLKKFSEKYSATGERGSMVNDEKIDEMLEQLEVKDGAKLKFFLNFLSLCESAGEKLLVFSQYILPLKLLERLSAKLKGWSPGKELFMITGDSNTEHRECSMERFNNSPDAKVFFGSIKACGEGISLVGASRIIILDIHLNPSVTRQAIGRAFRPGQTKKVYVYRLVAADSPEEEDYLTCSKKEFVSKMWFEWNEYCRDQEFVAKTIDVDECDDAFLESPNLREDVKVLYKR